MAEKTPQEILDDLHAAQIEAQKAGLIDQREKTDAVIGEAVGAQTKENTGAGADYNNYQKTNAGKSETSGMYAYNAYRSRLSAAAKAAQNAKEKADLSYNMTKANANANLSNAQAAEKAARNEQYWKQQQWDYQLAADEAAKQAAEEAKQASRRSYSTSATDNSAARAEAGALAMKPIDTVMDIVSNMKGQSDEGQNKRQDNKIPDRRGKDFARNKNEAFNELISQAQSISDDGKLRVSKKDREKILNEAIALGYDKNSDEYKALLFYLKGRAGTSSYYL